SLAAAFCDSPDAFKIVFNSACAITGKYLENNKKNVPNIPIVPTKIPTSINEGVYVLHVDGKYVRHKVVTIITKRSNHIPILTTIDRTKVAITEVRIFLNQNNCGDTTLHPIMIQYDQASGPVARFKNAYCSHSTPEYQATNNSVR